MEHTKEQLKQDLYNLGIRPGDMVLMHSSFKSLGGIEDGAKGFFEVFLDLLGEDGTLIVPALSFDTVTYENPVFDIDKTPSCIGYLSEFFRTEVPGVVRSMHATHSCCAYGKLAKELVKDHEKDITPVGKNSPFSKLPLYNGKILILGCGPYSNTSMHGVEETAEPPYCIDRENPIEYILKDGDSSVRLKSYRHNFHDANGDHIGQRYDRIVGLLDENEFNIGYVLKAECYLFDAKAVWKKGHDKLLSDPLYFVDYPKED